MKTPFAANATRAGLSVRIAQGAVGAKLRTVVGLGDAPGPLLTVGPQAEFTEAVIRARRSIKA